MPIHDLKDQIARLPEQPGVYLYFNAAGETIYVGKARRCATACAATWAPTASSPKTDALLDEVVRLEVIVTDSVVEALALENNLIKQRTPQVQHPAARRQELPVPAADDERGVSARAGGARASSATAASTPGPFLPAQLRAPDDGADAPAVRHPLVQRGDHRQARPARASSTTSSAASRRAWTTICSPERVRRAPSSDTRLFLEGRNEELVETLRGADGRGRRRRALRGGGAAARRDAHGADAARAAAEDGDAPSSAHRDVFGLKLGPARRRRSRSSRCAAAASSSASSSSPSDRHRAVRARARCSRRRSQQFYEMRTRAAGGPLCRSSWTSARRSRRGSASAPAASVRIVVPQRGEKRGLRRPGHAQRGARLRHALQPETRRNYEALETLQRVLRAAGAAAPHRVLRHLDDPGQRDRGVDGGVRRRPDEARRSIGSSGSGARARRSDRVTQAERPTEHASSTTSPRCSRSCSAAIARVLEDGGPFPDLIVIDGGKGQLDGAYEALEALGLANLVAVGLAKKEELLFTRDSASPIALATRRPGAAAAAADPRRGAPLRRDVPPPGAGDARPALGARRRARRRPAAPADAAARRSAAWPACAARRARSSRRVVGAKVADAVLRHFGS